MDEIRTRSECLVGRSVPRLEDAPLVTGKGRYLDDLAPNGCLAAAFLRSPLAHARIRTIDTRDALSMPGVVAVYTAKELVPLLPGGRKLVVGLPSSAIAFSLDRPILAVEETVYVGEPLVLVVAQSRAQAEDAIDVIDVDLDPLPIVSDCKLAITEKSAPAHRDLPHNRLAEFGFAFGDCERAFAQAERIVSGSYVVDRGGAHSMEGRGVLARLDELSGRLDVWSSTQTPHALKKNICKLLDRRDETVSVTVPIVGGGFGPKLVTYSEEIAVPAVALALGRPVKWVEDRREHFLSSCQEREQHWEMQLAIDPKGIILGLRGTLIHDHGAYTARGLNVPYASGMMMPLIYQVPAYEIGITVAVTNKTPVTPVRGAGQPQAAYVMERLMDAAAAATGLDRAEIRLRNLLPPEAMPCEKPLRLRSGDFVKLDSGNYPEAQTSAMNSVNWAEFEDRKTKARSVGRRLGIGLANYVEGTGRGPYETVTVRMTRAGRIQVNTGATDMGQGIGTALAQIIGAHLGGDISLIDLTLGDTAEPYGFGGFNSRLTVVAGASADAAARKVREQALRVAAHILGVETDELEIDWSLIRVKNTNRSIGFGELATAAEGLPGYRLPGIEKPGLMATERIVIDGMAFSNGCCIAEVEVDEETGAVDVLNLHLTHDCGRMVNPAMVDGQICGGLAHGLGNALYEKMVFDEEAQPLTTTLADYLLISAAEMPSISVNHMESASPLNALGVKGVGESGVIPTVAAIASAVDDALSDLNITVTVAPITPQALRSLICEAKHV